jgi:hypothetical protein
MAAPVITNLSPSPQELGSVKAPIRFSIRPQVDQVSQDSLECYVGESFVFYRGDVLPETLTYPKMFFKALSGTPVAKALRSIVDSFLKIEKLIPSTQTAASYFLGGLDSPSAPGDPLMVEFTLKLQQADLSNTYINGFTGVMLGLLTGSTGATVRFFSDGVNRRVELWSARQAETAAPGPSFIGAFDWEGENTYKLLWYPDKDLVKLYVSTGPTSLVSDILLAYGSLASLGSIPAPEQRDNVPWVFFGHGYPGPVSTSYWKDVFFYNYVFNPVTSGLPVGGCSGFVESSNIQLYAAEETPVMSGRPWFKLPDFSGDYYLENKRLVMSKTDPLDNLGFYRVEPLLYNLPFILDFKISGTLVIPDPNSASSGIELYFNDGLRVCKVALLYYQYQQFLGIQVLSEFPKASISYLKMSRGWGSEGFYRLLSDGTSTKLIQFVPMNEGSGEELLFEVANITLPTAPVESVPSVGFLHNLEAAESVATLKIAMVRYLPDLRFLYPTTPLSPIPATPWQVENSAGLSSTGDDFVLSQSGTTIYRLEPNAGQLNGFTAEFRFRIDSYGVGNPINALSGVGVVLDDGTYKLELMFADAGPVVGKIAFLTQRGFTYEETLLGISAGNKEFKGTYTTLDWTKFSHYRLEKVTGGRLRLFVNENDTPVLDMSTYALKYAVTSGTKYFKFGNLLPGYPSVSRWQYVKYNLSTGVDVSVLRPGITDETRFDMAVNTIVEAASL